MIKIYDYKIKNQPKNKKLIWDNDNAKESKR